MKRIAILGGTFDPIHIGHIIAGQCVYDTGLYDEICVMPSGNPPHKTSTEHYNDHRLMMCQKSIEDIEGFSVSDLELKREGKIYSVDTFEQLKASDPETEYWLIIGTDSLMNLHQWYAPERLLEAVNFVVVDRGGYDISVVNERMYELDRLHKAKFLHVSMPLIELSSSEIRQRIADNKSIRFRVADKVHSYIMKNNLYKSER